MHQPKDYLGTDIAVGDVIAYTTRRTNNMNTHIATVDAIIDNGLIDSRYRYQLCVRVYNKYYRYVNTWVSGVYRRRLVSNETIVKLDRAVLPLDVLKAFDTTERFNCI